MRHVTIAGAVQRLLSLVTVCIFSMAALQAQPPSHDPSSMIRNTDGRYWIFTTGDGVWAMSSPTADFSSWRAESPVFPIGTWPGWIAGYVSGFGGFFWAPEVVRMNNQYYCYYSCAGVGAPAAIGVATATNLAGPWTDRGMVVAANNAIDPSILIDGSGVYMAYGNWQTGIDLVQLNPSTGLRQGTGRWDLVAGSVEAPFITKNGSYYYLFFQRGLCCQGVNSGYYTQVGRATSITGPYLDQNGISLMNDGGTTFLPNKNGRYIGPGHIGYGEGKLTYHFYDGNDNGAPKLMITTMSWSNGWPVPATASQLVLNGTYRLQNRNGGKFIDNLGATTNGAAVVQWPGSPSNNQRWVITYSGGYYKLRCVTGGRYLDNIGNTADGSTVGQWQSSSSTAQQWTIASAGPYYKIINRANGKAVDNGGNTADGAVMQHWYSNVSWNQQWTLEYVSSATTTNEVTGLVHQSVTDEPAPVIKKLTVFSHPLNKAGITISLTTRERSPIGIRVTNIAGQVVYAKQLGMLAAGTIRQDIELPGVSCGVYVVTVSTNEGLQSARIIRH